VGVCIWEEEERVESSGGRHLYELGKPDVHSNHGLHGRGVCHKASNDIEVWFFDCRLYIYYSSRVELKVCAEKP